MGESFGTTVYYKRQNIGGIQQTICGSEKTKAARVQSKITRK